MNVNASARAVSIDFDPILERYNSVTLGKIKSNLADTIVRQSQSIAKAQNQTVLQSAVDRATDWITNGRGYMVAVRNYVGDWIEICSLDDPDINNAVNVWRWNNGGFGFSSTGYGGPYKYAITQDGHIVADFITAGSLDASLLKTGVIASEDGTVQVDLVNNKVTIATLIDGREGKLELSAEGINGYGWDAATESYYHTLRIDPGGKASENHESFTVITSGDSTAGLSVAGAKKDSVTQVGHSTGNVRIVGSNIEIGYKSISWKDNGDGTFALIGQ